MPKTPRVSGDDVVRALGRLGFVEVRRRGSPIVLGRGAMGCVVPAHRELKTGTLFGILKQAGVSHDEFVAALHA